MRSPSFNGDALYILPRYRVGPRIFLPSEVGVGKFARLFKFYVIYAKSVYPNAANCCFL